MSRKGRPSRLALAVFFALVMICLYTPLLYLLVQTFLTNPNDLSSPFTLKWLVMLFEDPELLEPLLTSLQIAFMSACLSVSLGTFGAVGLNRAGFKSPGFLRGFIMLPILLPEVITGLSLLLFFLVLHIPLGTLTIVLAHASFSASFVYFIMVEQLRKLDPQISEAAEDLGAKPSVIFWRVILPNILPGLLAGWLLAFTISFDDFLISFFTSGAGVTTLPLKIYSLMRIGITPEINGLAFVMLAISSLLVFVLVTRGQGKSLTVKGS